MKYIVHFSRIFVGILFIISGFIKLNDPIGFSYKLDEYCQVFGLQFLVPATLAFALFMVILEVVLGVMLLVGFKPKFTVYSLLALIVFFTFLTFYSAFFNVVKDCGCFGDALKLTPWESFTKDLVLLVFIVIILSGINFIKPLFSEKLASIISIASILLSFFMGYYVLSHLPLIDFRAYAVGKNIQKGMEFPEGAQKSEYEMQFIYKVNGKNKTFSEKDLMNLPTGAKFVERKDKLIKEGYVPPIHDFSLEFNGEDQTHALLQEPKLMLFVMHDINKASEKGIQLLINLQKEAKNKNYKIIAVTASTTEDINFYKKKLNLNFDFYFCDGTTLKTIERSNPSIVILNKGTITQKVHFNDIDELNL